MSIKIGFIGAGFMAEAIIKGILSSGLYKPQEIMISDIDPRRTQKLQKGLGLAVAKDNQDLVKVCPVVLLAVKPQYVLQILEMEKVFFKEEHLIISIAAGITIKDMETIVGEKSLVRVMPNTPALVGAGMSALAFGVFVQDEKIDLVKEIFSTVGEIVVLDEKLINGATGVSGSGPAYVYQFIEAMADGGVQSGLPRDIAYKLAAQTMVGAGLMVLKTGLHPGQLKDMVTSPGGTTIRAISILEKAGVRGAIMEAVEAAYLWSANISEEKN